MSADTMSLHTKHLLTTHLHTTHLHTAHTEVMNAEAMSSARLNAIALLQQRWQNSGLAAGDLVLLHSNIMRTLVEFQRQQLPISAQDILQSLLLTLGPQGTLVMPLFNFDFANGVAFDIRHTQSHMGALTEAARMHPAAVRTGHPIYSFAVIGAKAADFAQVNNYSAYAADSPFGMVTALGGKIAALDLDDQQCMTYYHHVEEMLQVDYRYFKAFSGAYTDAQGQCTQKTYQIYVRDLAKGVITRVNPAGELLWQAGLYHGFRPRVGSGVRWAFAQQMFDFTADVIRQQRALGTLYALDTPT